MTPLHYSAQLATFTRMNGDDAPKNLDVAKVVSSLLLPIWSPDISSPVIFLGHGISPDSAMGVNWRRGGFPLFKPLNATSFCELLESLSRDQMKDEQVIPVIFLGSEILNFSRGALAREEQARRVNPSTGTFKQKVASVPNSQLVVQDGVGNFRVLTGESALSNRGRVGRPKFPWIAGSLVLRRTMDPGPSIQSFRLPTPRHMAQARLGENLKSALSTLPTTQMEEVVLSGLGTASATGVYEELLATGAVSGSTTYRCVDPNWSFSGISEIVSFLHAQSSKGLLLQFDEDSIAGFVRCDS